MATEPLTIKHVEFEGYKFDIDMDVFDDVEFFKLADDLDKGDSSKLIDIFVMALGQSGYDKLAAYFKKRDGRLRMSTLQKLTNVIFGLADPKESASGTPETTISTN